MNNGAGQDDIEIPVSTVINTLPLTLSMRMLEPSPPPDLCAIENFENLYLTGRSSLFRYLHLHDLFKVGAEVVEQIANS